MKNTYIFWCKVPKNPRLAPALFTPLWRQWKYVYKIEQNSNHKFDLVFIFFKRKNLVAFNVFFDEATIMTFKRDEFYAATDLIGNLVIYVRLPTTI